MLPFYLAQCQVTARHNGQKRIQLMTSHTKKQHQKTFFHCKLEVFWGFEQLSSTIGWWVMELQKLGQYGQIKPFKAKPGWLQKCYGSFNLLEQWWQFVSMFQWNQLFGIDMVSCWYIIVAAFVLFINFSLGYVCFLCWYDYPYNFLPISIACRF